jgi:hypothetical protein
VAIVAAHAAVISIVIKYRPLYAMGITRPRRSQVLLTYRFGGSYQDNAGRFDRIGEMLLPIAP